MVRAVLRTKTGQRAIVLGLTTANLEKLKAREPILCLFREALGEQLDLDVIVTWGETKDQIVADLQRSLTSSELPKPTEDEDFVSRRAMCKRIANAAREACCQILQRRYPTSCPLVTTTLMMDMNDEAVDSIVDKEMNR